MRALFNYKVLFSCGSHSSKRRPHRQWLFSPPPPPRPPEVLYHRAVQHESCHCIHKQPWSGWQTWLRPSCRYPPASKMVGNPPQKHAFSSIKACPTCVWELCLQDSKDRNPPPLHLASPAVVGSRRSQAGRRRGSSTGFARLPTPQEALLLWRLSESTCRQQHQSKSLPLPRSLWGLGFTLLALMSGVSFCIFSFSLCKMVFGGWGFFQFVWWFLGHPSQQLLISTRNSGNISGIKFVLTLKYYISVSSVQCGISRSSKCKF